MIDLIYSKQDKPVAGGQVRGVRCPSCGAMTPVRIAPDRTVRLAQHDREFVPWDSAGPPRRVWCRGGGSPVQTQPNPK